MGYESHNLRWHLYPNAAPCPSDPRFHLRPAKGLGDVVHCPQFKSSGYVLNICLCRKENHWNIFCLWGSFQPLTHPISVHPGHDDIQENEVSGGFSDVAIFRASSPFSTASHSPKLSISFCNVFLLTSSSSTIRIFKIGAPQFFHLAYLMTS